MGREVAYESDGGVLPFLYFAFLFLVVGFGWLLLASTIVEFCYEVVSINLLPCS